MTTAAITQATTSLSQTWSVAAPAQDVATFACSYADPFWTDQFTFDGDTRTIVLPDGPRIVETLTVEDELSYEYTATGVPGINGYHGTFAAADGDGSALSWTTTFVADDGPILVHMLTINANAVTPMSRSLAEKFPSG